MNFCPLTKKKMSHIPAEIFGLIDQFVPGLLGHVNYELAISNIIYGSEAGIISSPVFDRLFENIKENEEILKAICFRTRNIDIFKRIISYFNMDISAEIYRSIIMIGNYVLFTKLFDHNHHRTQLETMTIIDAYYNTKYTCILPAGYSNCHSELANFNDKTLFDINRFNLFIRFNSIDLFKVLETKGVPDEVILAAARHGYVDYEFRRIDLLITRRKHLIAPILKIFSEREGTFTAIHTILSKALPLLSFDEIYNLLENHRETMNHYVVAKINFHGMTNEQLILMKKVLEGYKFPAFQRNGNLDNLMKNRKVVLH